MSKLAGAAMAASLILLAACGGDAGNSANASANASAGNEATPAANEAKPANAAAPANSAEAAPSGGDGTLSREYMVGRWTEMDDCAGGATEFRADGTFVFPWGDTGTWRLEGDRMMMSTNTEALRVRVVDQNTVEVTSTSRTYRSTRCT